MSQSYDPVVVFDPKANRNSAILWGLVVVSFLTMTLCLGAAAIRLANGDQSVAVVENYYDKAVAWDTTQQIQRESDALRWVVQLSTDREQSLHIDIRDSQSQPVQIADANIVAYHHADATRQRKYHVSGISDGSIAIESSIDRPGFWTIELDMTDIDGHRFVRKIEREFRLDR